MLNTGSASKSNIDQIIAELQHNFTKFRQQTEVNVLELQRDANRTVSDLEHKLTLALDVIANQQHIMTEQEQRLNKTEAGQQIRFKDLEHRYNKTIAGQKIRIAHLEDVILKQNQTIEVISKQQQQFNHTTADQQLKILELGDVVLKQNRTFTQDSAPKNGNVLGRNNTNQGDYVQGDVEMEQRINKSLSAYQIILHDVVDRQNQQVAVFNNETLALGRRIDSLAKQFHYLALSASELDDKMNTSFSAYEVILHDIVDRHNHHVTLFNNQTRITNQRITDMGKQFHYLSLSVLADEKKTSLLNATLQGKIDTVDQNGLNQGTYLMF